MKPIFPTAFWLTAALLSASANAATINFNQQHNLIYLGGEMTIEDINKFDALTAPYHSLAVQLSSPGGAAIAGVRIGELIRARGFITYITRDTFSFAHPLVRLRGSGGVKRIISTTGRVGFHGVYDADTLQQSGPGNAIVGSFLGKLGLSDAAIIYITHTGARDKQWLTAEDARQIGIEAEEIKCTGDDCTFTSLTTYKIESRKIGHTKEGYYTTAGADEIAELITSIAFLRDNCGRTLTYFDEGKYANCRGYQLADFGAERQYVRLQKRRSGVKHNSCRQSAKTGPALLSLITG